MVVVYVCVCVHVCACGGACYYIYLLSYDIVNLEIFVVYKNTLFFVASGRYQN